MKTTTHKILFDLPDGHEHAPDEIEDWLSTKYGSHKRLIHLKVSRTVIGTELKVQYSFENFDDANMFYRRTVMRILKDLQQSFNARIASQTSSPSDYADSE